MKAIILAAGEGIRMRPLTLTKPKPLLEVNGRPILAHIISNLPEEVNELVLVVGYLGEQIINYCGNEFLGKHIDYVWQKQKLGTFHALKLCEPFIRKGERFFVLFADDIHGSAGIKKCLDYQCSLLVEEVEDPRRFGVVKINSDYSITEFIEKPENPPSKLVSTGVLLLDSNIFDYDAEVHLNGEYYLTSALSKMLKDGHKVHAVKSTLWLPIGYPEDLEKAEKALTNLK